MSYFSIFASIFIIALILSLSFLIYQLIPEKKVHRNRSRTKYSDHTDQNIQKNTVNDVVSKLLEIEGLLGINSNPIDQNFNKQLFLARFDKVFQSIEELQEKLHQQRTSRLITIAANSASRTNSEEQTQFSSPEFLSLTENENKDSLRNLYNQAVSDRSVRPQFWSKYNAVTLGNKNAVDQRLGNVTKPDFRETSNGDFIAIERDSRSYYVFPQFDLTLTPQKYKEGGIQDVFSCPAYDLNSSYSNIKVRQPALFERAGDQWKVIKVGELIL